MTKNKKELITIDLNTWTNLVRQNERQAIEIETLKRMLRNEDEIDVSGTLEMWDEENSIE